MNTQNDNHRFGKNRIKALERDDYKCVKCSMTNEQHETKYGRSITVDHIDGKGMCSKEKNHALDNLQTLCFPCHIRKDLFASGKRGFNANLNSVERRRIVPSEQVCFGCKTMKSVDQYYKRFDKRGIPHRYCKPCFNKRYMKGK